MKKTIQMSMKKSEHLSVMRQVDKKNLTPALAGQELGFSLKQTKREGKRHLSQRRTGAHFTEKKAGAAIAELLTAQRPISWHWSKPITPILDQP